MADDTGKRSNTFEFGASLDNFRDTLARKSALPENLDKPLRALVGQLAALIEKAPVSVYLTSDDDDRELRDHFAFLLATYLRDREATTLLVDGDYMSVGLSGLVPQRDALGFLDLLLYGSSLGVITQDGPNHLRVVGAGSFPVSKRNPFIMEAFGDAHRYLLSHSRCLIYIGPVINDNEEMHPLAEHLDLVIAVGRGRRQRIRSTKLEEKLRSAAGQEVWHVRITDPAGADSPQSAAQEPPAQPPPPAEATKPAAEPSPRPAPAPPPAEEKPAAAAKAEPPPEPEPPPAKEKPSAPSKPPPLPEPPDIGFDRPPPGGESAGNSMLPKIVTFAVGFLVVAFIVWWLYQTKVFRDGSEPPTVAQRPAPEQTTQEPAPVQDAGGTEGTQSQEAGDVSSDPATAGDDVAGAGDDASTGTSTSEPTETESTPPAQDTQTDQESTTPPAQDEGGAEGTQPQGAGETTPDPEPTGAEPITNPPTDTAPTPQLEAGVTVVEGLDDYSGAYLVHISSFRELERASVEAQSLADRGYAVVVALVDTGSKGLYHRVYVGPYEFREAARMEKIKLDEIPFVKFTRITKVPG